MLSDVTRILSSLSINKYNSIKIMGIGNLSNTRLLRSLLVLVFLIVTIFVYTLYSTTLLLTPGLQLSNKLIAASDRPQQQQLLELLPPTVELNNAGEFSLSAGEEEDKLLRIQFAQLSASPNPMNDIKRTSHFKDYQLKQQLNKVTFTSLPKNHTTELIKNVEPTKVILASKTFPHSSIFTRNLYESGHLNEEIDVEHICQLNGLTTKLLILITSALGHAHARMSIRQTWGHYGARRDIGIAFVLGRSLNETLNAALSEENYLYGDLIRGNFFDSYENLTLKVVSALEWADKRCHRAKYILKTDDDMFINVPRLLNFVTELDRRQETRAIFGRLAKKWKPVRNRKSKYYVSANQYPGKVFPSFTTGPAYVITGDIVHDLYERSLETVYLKLEDVFVTGIVAQSLGIERLHVNEFINRRIDLTSPKIRKSISIHMIRSSEQFDLWRKLHNHTTKY